MYKKCKFCHHIYKKNYYLSRMGWFNQECCSRSCAAKYRIYKGILPPSRKGKAPWHKGKHNPYFTGANNPKWKGGVSKKNKTERMLAMETIEYKLWRSSVFERDNYTCQGCEIRGARLEADHIKPWSLFPKLRYTIDNGKTLCVRCHRKLETAKLNQYNQKQVYEQVCEWTS